MGVSSACAGFLSARARKLRRTIQWLVSTPEERRIVNAIRNMFETMRREELPQCCTCMTPAMLSPAGCIALGEVLQQANDPQVALFQYHEIVESFHAGIVDAQKPESEAGRFVTRDEFVRAFVKALADYTDKATTSLTTQFNQSYEKKKVDANSPGKPPKDTPDVPVGMAVQDM